MYHTYADSYILIVNFIVFLLYFENADFFHSFSTLTFYLFITLESNLDLLHINAVRVNQHIWR